MSQIQLPDWVIARLRQDNPDIAQAIVDLVVWSDRVKCWMYQADADFERIKNLLETNPKTRIIEDDYYKGESTGNAAGEDLSVPAYEETAQTPQTRTTGRNQARRPAKDSGSSRGIEF